jgi:hypothetical protein
MSMNTSGTRRIVNRQIEEWHAVVEAERAAKSIDEGRRAHDSSPSLVARAFAALDGLRLALRRRLRGRVAD